MSEMTPTPAPTPATGETPTPTTTWTSGLNDEVKGWVENKGFKDPAAVIDSYRNFEKLMGAPKERIIKLPEKSDDPAWNDIYGRLGRPGDPKEYDLKAIPDPKFGEFSKKTFHELGLTKKQGEALAEKWKEYYSAGATEASQAADAKAAQEESDLKKEWGTAHEQNINIAKRAAAMFKLDPDSVDGLEKTMGYKKTMAFLHEIGSKLGEGTFIGGEGGNSGALTPAAALNQINTLMADSTFSHKYSNGDAEAKAKMEALHKMAYPAPSAN
jgi:hypothetical protein